MPIVAVPGMLEALLCAPRVVGVSPVVEAVEPRTPPEAGRYRVRGRLMEMLGLEHSADAVAGLWAGLVDGFVVDKRDVDAARRINERLGIPVLRTDLLPMGPKGRTELAAQVVEFGLGLPARAVARSPPVWWEPNARDFPVTTPVFSRFPNEGLTTSNSGIGCPAFEPSPISDRGGTPWQTASIGSQK
jgi:hypothetical protein